MKRILIFAVTLIAIGVIGQLSSLRAFAGGQGEKLTASQLKSMLEGLGYEVKTLNSEVDKEKYEFPNTKGGYDIPVAAEISASKNYIWLTVFLGEAPKADSTPASKYEAFLKANFNIQPCFFYITTKGNLMLGVAIDNRNVNAATLKRLIEKLVDDTSKNADIWK